MQPLSARILLCSPDPQRLDALEQAVEAAGHRTAARVQDPEAALDQARQSAPDLILLDLSGPDPDRGLAACRAIQAELGLPVVLAAPPGREGTLASAVGLGRDLGRLMANQAHVETLGLIMEHTDSGLSIWEPDLTLVYANPAYLRLVGRTIQDLAAVRVEDFCDPGEFARERVLIEELRAGGREFYELEKDYLRPDGERVRVRVHVAAQRDTAGAVRHFIASATDLTAQRRAEKEAQAASRAKNEFLANMSHEVRTPLNGILGMLQLLGMSGLDPDQARCAEVALESAHTLQRVFDDILDLARIEAGLMTCASTPFGPARAAATVVDALRPRVEAKGLGLDLRLGPDLPEACLGDEGRLRQVLYNLLDNAAKFTDRGRVSLDLARQPDAGPGRAALRFTVRDTGPGIPPGDLERVFQPFTQGDGSYTRRYPGLGLGLSIARRLAQCLGGTLSVQSLPGQGCAFTLDLDLPLPARSPRVAALTEPPARPLRILVAEDDTVNQVTALGLLRKIGHQARVAENGQEALDRLAAGSFDLVLMDIQMPVMDGLEAVRRIRSGEAPGVARDIPIIALTAHAMSGDREGFLASGMDAYLAKPLDFPTVRRTIEEVMAARETGKCAVDPAGDPGRP